MSTTEEPRVVPENDVQEEGEPDSTEDITPDLYARLNERFSLVLEGSSWLFIEAYPEGGIAYDGRMRDETYMRFSFRALKNGTYVLQFVQGGSGGGSGRTHRTAVEVLPDAEFVAKVTGVSVPRDSEDEIGLLSGADADTDAGLSREERYAASLDHLLNKQWEQAFRVLTDSGDFDPAAPSRETAAAFAAALFRGDYMLALDYANFPPSLQRDFADSILNLGKELPVELRRRLLTGSLDLLPRFHGMDKLLFFPGPGL